MINAIIFDFGDIFINLDKIADENKFTTWAYTIMQRLYLDKLRYNKRRPQVTSFDELNAIVGFEVEFEDKKVDIESEVMCDMINTMNSRKVRAMVNNLRPSYSIPLSLNTYGVSNAMDIAKSNVDGMELTQVSKLTDMDNNVTKVRLHRARQALQKVMVNNSFSSEEYFETK